MIALCGLPGVGLDTSEYVEESLWQEQWVELNPKQNLHSSMCAKEKTEGKTNVIFVKAERLESKNVCDKTFRISPKVVHGCGKER